MNICIFGASSNRLNSVFVQDAEKAGRLIAQAGHTLIFGGGADGLMGACARGALAVGGRAVGIAPQLFDEPGFLIRDEIELILTRSIAERKEKMFSLSDAFLSLPGGIGTMDEFFEAITLRQLGLLSGPLVLLNTLGFYEPLIRYLDSMAEQGFMSRNCLSLLRLRDTPEAALEALLTPDNLTGSIRRLEDYTK